MAAAAVSPPRPNLSWNDVVEYAFLTDFDLLRDSRQDVHDCPWTKPACRVVIDQHFKLERAREEIQRLNVEIHRVVTYIQEKDAFFCLREAEVRQVNPGLVRQVKIHQREKGGLYSPPGVPHGSARNGTESVEFRGIPRNPHRMG